MSYNTQLYRGVIEGAILKIISTSETYGYEIYQKLKEYGFDEFAEGSLYPILLRLERNNFIIGNKKKSPLGPERKYYNLTQSGEELLSEFEKQWEKIVLNMKRIWEHNKI